MENKTTLSVLMVLIIVLIAFYKYFTKNFNYWEKMNVPFVKPWPVFGNLFDVFVLRKSISLLLWDVYDRYNSPYIGIFALNTPKLVIKDLELIRQVLIKDFSIFCDRSVITDTDCDPLVSKMSFFVKNPEWKYIRTKMTPIFTSGKIKVMTALINEAADGMKSYLNMQLDKGPIDVREICLKYTTDVIASCAFGLNAKSFDKDHGQLRKVGRALFEYNWKNAVRQVLYIIAPNLAKVFNIPFLDQEMANILRDTFWRTIKEREKTKQVRNDFIDIIIQMKNETNNYDNLKFEGDMVVAQVIQFYAAGFETTGTALSFALYELCLASNIQNKLRREIRTSISQHGGLTYEAVQNMKYLDMVVSETLRKYPPLSFLERNCAEDYIIPNSDVVLKKDSQVFISVLGLHFDSKYFPDPKKFSPERFSEENKDNIPNFSYLPFGDGPRNCIGSRFGLLVTKLGLAHIISEFVVEKSFDLPIPIKLSPKGIILVPSTKLNLNFRKIVAE